MLQNNYLLSAPPDAQFNLSDFTELGILSPLKCFITILAIVPEPKSTNAYPAQSLSFINTKYYWRLPSGFILDHFDSNCFS